MKSKLLEQVNNFCTSQLLAWLVLFAVLCNGFFIVPSVAQAAITPLLNFQGKLTATADGTNVANGNYDFQFKIYDAPTGGNLLWTETWDAGTSKIAVTNGVFSAKLGTHTSLSTVSFNTNSLYLSINFNPGSGYDGEMSPRKQLLASPYAFNANSLEGTGRINLAVATANISPLAITGYSLTGSNAQSLMDLSGTWNTSGTPTALKLNVTDTASNASSLLLDLQVGGVSRAKIDKAGNLTVTSCVGCGGGSTLQQAYDATSGNTIALTDARNLALTLQDTTTDPNFTITTATGGAGFTSFLRADGAGTADPAQLVLIDNLDTNRAQPIALKVQSAAGTITTALDVSDAEIDTAIAIGSNDITTGATTISSAELDRLDGKDAALVDTNDAVTTAITGTGALNAGSITSGFGSIDVGNDAISTTGTISGATINASTALQTGGATRIDATGNLTNIGNLTATGSLTIASSGAGNDIVINGADILDVQDAATFAGTVTFNSTTSFQADDIVDAEVSDTLTSSIFIGSGSTTNAIDLATAEVAGTLAIGNGGTGATTSQGAINAISQLTTEGDLLYHNGTNSTRLARGSNGQCLTSNATTIVWGSCGGAVSLSSLTAAGATNTIDNTNFAQTWNWSTAATENPFTWTANALSTGTLFSMTSSSTALTSGGLLNIVASGAPATSWTGNVAKIEYNSADVDVDGTALKVGILGAAAGDGTALNVTTAQTGSSAYALRVNDDGTYTDSTPFVVDATGEVGIGTATPNVLLHILSSATSTDQIRVQSTATNVYSSIGFFDSGATQRGSFGYAGSTTGDTYADSVYLSAIGKKLNFTDGINIRMTLDTNGYFGIGDTTPNSPLHILSGATGLDLLRVEATGTGVYSSIGFFDNSGTQRGSFGYAGTGTAAPLTDSVFFSANGKKMNFSTNNGVTVYLTLDTTSNFGIGETSPGSKLSVSGNASIGASYDTTAAPTNGLIVQGSVGIGLTSPTAILHVQQSADSADTTNPVAFNVNSAGATGELTASSGVQTFAQIAPTLNQSGTAGYTVLKINSTETATGSGSKLLLDLQVGGSSRASISNSGALTLNTALTVANGGTGATTSQGAINAISQLTTEGDLLYHNGTNSTRLARGANGECLTSNATTIVWGSCGGAVSLSSLTAAGATNTIDNTNYAQTWNWSTAATENPFTWTANALTTGTLFSMTSSSTGLTSGGLLDVVASGAPAASWTGNVAKIEYNSADADVDGTALKVGILGAAAGDGVALNITTAQTGSSAYALRVNDDGTYTDATPFVVDASGNVGIQTATPAAMLSFGNNVNAQQILVYHSSNTRMGIGVAGSEFRNFTHTGAAITFGHLSTADGTSFTERFRMDSSGNISVGSTGDILITGGGELGIGTSSPSADISLGNSTAAQKILVYEDASNRYGFGIQAFEFRQFFPSNAHLSLGTISTADASTFSEKARLDSTGFFGIGTTSPAGVLHVVSPAQTVASASTAEYTSGTFTPPTITLTGSTQVTAQMDSFIFNQPTITDASAVTVDDAVTLTVAGAPIRAGSVALTDTYAIKVNAGAVSTATRSYGLYVDAQTGATNNYAASFATGNVGVGTATPTSIFNVVTAANAVDGVALFSGAADNVGLSINNTGTGGAKWFFDSTGGTSGYGQGKLAVGNGSSGFPGVPTAIFSGNNFGIGLISPTSYLHVQQNADTTTTATPIALDVNSAGATGELTASSGVQTFARIAPVVNQSSTAGYTALLVNSTQTATGSGSKLLLDLQVGGSSVAKVDSAGALTVTSCTGCGGGGSALSGLTAATGTNTINNANHAQTWQWNSLTTETAFTKSTSSVTSGVLQKFSNTSTVATSADLVQGDHTATYTASTTVSGNLLDLSRALTINGGGQTLTVNSAVAQFTDNCTVSAGTCTSSADVVRIQQSYASNTGAALNIANGAGASSASFRVNDDGTFTDSTPFYIDSAGNVNIGATGGSAKLVVVNGDAAGVGVIVKAAGSQTANLQEWQDSSANVRTYIDKDGYIAPVQVRADGGDTLLFTDSTGATTWGTLDAGSFIWGATPKFTIDANGITAVNLNDTATTNGICHSGTDVDAATDTTRNLVACSAAPGDIAEFYETQAGIEAGDVVVASSETFAYTEPLFDPITGMSTGETKDRVIPVLKKANASYGPVMGIISTSPYQSFGKSVITAGAKNPKPLALNGRVPVNISLENGPIAIGDYLTASETKPGYAMKATRSGFVIGQALESYSAITGDLDRIMTFVDAGYRMIGYSFVLGDEDGQLAGGASGGATDALDASFLVDQRGSADIMHLQKDGVDRLIVANDGSVSILAEQSDLTKSLFVVSNSQKALFTITAAGHITVSKDTAGTAKIDPGNRTTRVTYKTPYAVTPQVVITPKGSPVAFALVNETPDGFTITIDRIAEMNIFFNWIALATEDDSISVSEEIPAIVPAASVPQDEIMVQSQPASPEPTAPEAAPESQPSESQPTPEQAPQEELSSPEETQAPADEPVVETQLEAPVIAVDQPIEQAPVESTNP